MCFVLSVLHPVSISDTLSEFTTPGPPWGMLYPYRGLSGESQTLTSCAEKASGLDAAGAEGADEQTETRLPATLVRIPAEPSEKAGE